MQSLFLILLSFVCLASGTTLNAASLFVPEKASLKQVISKGAHWKKESTFCAGSVLSRENGKEYLKISFSGNPGNGVGIVYIKVPEGIASKAPGTHIGGLSLDVGYKDKDKFYWQIFAHFKSRPTASASIRVTPGFKTYNVVNAKWKRRGKKGWEPYDGQLDWTQCDKLSFYYYQSSAKSDKYPVIYLGQINPIESFSDKALTLKDMRPIKHQIILVGTGDNKATAILPEVPEFRKTAQKALGRMEEQLGVKFAVKTEKEIGCSPVPGNYILFSGGANGPLSSRMAENSLIMRLSKGYEVRCIPNCLKNSVNILYIGGVTPSAMTQAVNRLLASGKFKGSIASYLDISDPPYNKTQCMELARKKFTQLKDIYKKNSKVFKKNTTAFKLLGAIADCYYYSNDDDIVKLFCRGIDILKENYSAAKNSLDASYKIPTFFFPYLIVAATKVDGSPVLTDKDRLMIANIICRVMDDTMKFWEMKKPLQMYREKKVEFVENHCLFASRAILQAAGYLTERFHIPRADYYARVAEYAFRGIDALKQQPEDAGGYQFICRMHWMEIHKKLGLNYNTPNLRYYIDFTIAQINQMGSAASYGDTSHISSFYGWNFLLAGKQFFNDPLCGYLLGKQQKLANSSWLNNMLAGMDFADKAPDNSRMLGLTVFPVDKNLLGYYQAENLNKKSPLNKAVFRSGYNPDDNYLLFGGMNSTDPHSHRDANTILQYSRGPHHWLTDVSYFRKSADEHNGITISCDNRVTDQRRKYKLQRHSFAEIEAQFNSPDKSMAILSTSLNDYADASWRRTIFWHKKLGFWCVDEITADKTADYVIKRRWRLLGNITRKNNIFTISQKVSGKVNIPNKLNIIRGDKAFTRVKNQIIVSHNHNGTAYKDYKYAGPLVQILIENTDTKLEKGQSIYLMDKFTHSAPVNIKRLGKTAWITPAQLVAAGSFHSDKLQFNGSYLFIADGQIMAADARSLIIDGKKISVPKQGELFISAPAGTGQILENLFKKIPEITSAQLPQINCPVLKNVQEFRIGENISAMAVAVNRILCGSADGNLTMLNDNGKQLWQGKINAPVTRIAVIARGDEIFWAVGGSNFDIKSGDGHLALFDNHGKMLWLKKLPQFGKNGGYVRALCKAKLIPGNEEQIVAGLKNKKIIAFNLAGKELWSQRINHHSSKYILAADLTGDGLDEIAASELWRTNFIFGPDGKKLQSSIRTIGYDHSVAAIKSAGVPTVIWGNSDSYIRGFNLRKKYGEQWASNAGGIPTGVVETSTHKIAVANNNNRVEFFDLQGHSTGTKIHFPAALLNLVDCKGKLYAFCADGCLYRFTANGITAKYKIPNFVEDVCKEVILQKYGNKLIMAYGKNVYLINN